MAFILFFLLTSCAEGDIVLTEVMFDPSGSEHYDEFVELYNTGPDTVDLEGWTVGTPKSWTGWSRSKVGPRFLREGSP